MNSRLFFLFPYISYLQMAHVLIVDAKEAEKLMVVYDLGFNVAIAPGVEWPSIKGNEGSSVC